MNEPTQRSLPDLFRAAADVIETNGWNRGDMYPGCRVGAKYCAGDPVCAVGALRVAAGKDPSVDPFDPLVAEACRLLSERVETLVFDEDPVELVAAWNDWPERTAGQVAVALRAAAVEVAS